jgi:hypothetical protein
MPAPAELRLDLPPLRPQALGNRSALHGEVPPPVIPADMREAQKGGKNGKRSWNVIENK